MRGRCVAVLGLALAFGVVSSQAADKGQKKKKARGGASVQLVGNLICAHCDAGIGETCNTGLRVDQVVFVIDGKVGEDLFDQRKSGTLQSVLGSISAKDGNLYVNGRRAAEPKNKKAKPRSVVVGKLAKVGDKLAIKNGKTNILVTGKAAKQLAELVDKRVRVIGKISADDKNQITVAGQRGSEATTKARKKKKDA